MCLLSRFLQQDTHDLRRWHHHLNFSSELLPLAINFRRSSYRSRAHPVFCNCVYKSPDQHSLETATRVFFSFDSKKESRNSFKQQLPMFVVDLLADVLVETERKAPVEVSFSLTMFFLRVVSLSLAFLLIAAISFLFDSIEHDSASRMTRASIRRQISDGASSSMVQSDRRLTDFCAIDRINHSINSIYHRPAIQFVARLSSFQRGMRWRNVRRETCPSNAARLRLSAAS